MATPTTLGRTVLLVPDEEVAAAFCRDAFGFVTLHDSRLPDGQCLLRRPPAEGDDVVFAHRLDLCDNEIVLVQLPATTA